MKKLLLPLFLHALISVSAVATADYQNSDKIGHNSGRLRRQNDAFTSSGIAEVDECPTSISDTKHEKDRSKRDGLFHKANQPGSSSKRSPTTGKIRQHSFSRSRELTNQFILEEITGKVNCGQEEAFRRYLQKFRKNFSGHDFARRQCIFHNNQNRVKELNDEAKKSDERRRERNRLPNKEKPQGQETRSQQPTNQQPANQKESNNQNRGSDGSTNNDHAAVSGETPFSHLTYEEFISISAGAIADKNVSRLTITKQDLANNPQMAQNLQNQPPVFDLRKYNVILENVRSQGSCGSCYAFVIADQISAQRAFELKEARKTLSAQYVIDCASDGGGCVGGRVGKTMQRIVNDSRAVPLEQCYRYQAKNGACRREASCCLRRKVNWFQVIDVSGPHEKEIIAGLLQWGPLAAVVEASEVWQFYSGSGVVTSSQCPTGKQNHAIMIVGYNFQGSIPYYIARNSWSDEWGEKGYLKLEAGTNACSVAKIIMTTCAHDCEKVKSAKDRLGLPPPLLSS